MIVYRAFWVVREGRTEDEAMELFKEFPLEGPRRRQVQPEQQGGNHEYT